MTAAGRRTGSAAAGAGRDDGDAGRGTARPRPAGGVGRADRRRRRPPRPGGRRRLRRRVLPARHRRRRCARAGWTSRSTRRHARRRSSSRNRPTRSWRARSPRAPPSSPSIPGPAGNGCTGSSTTSSSITATAPTRCTTPSTDLFGLAQSIADRTHGMVSIEDAQSHVLAYSASNDEADELRRLSILGRAGPPEHLAWIGQCGHLRRAARQRRGGPRRRAARTRPAAAPRGRDSPARDRTDGARPRFAGTIWVQQGSRPLADDADEVLRGGGGAGRPHHVAAGGDAVDARGAGAGAARAARRRRSTSATVARELGIVADGRAAVIGFDGADDVTVAPRRRAGVERQRLSRRRAGGADRRAGLRAASRTPARPASVTSWIRGTIAALRTELGLTLRAVIAAPLATGLARGGGGARRGGPGTRQRASVTRAPSVR